MGEILEVLQGGMLYVSYAGFSGKDGYGASLRQGPSCVAR